MKKLVQCITTPRPTKTSIGFLKNHGEFGDEIAGRSAEPAMILEKQVCSANAKLQDNGLIKKLNFWLLCQSEHAMLSYLQYSHMSHKIFKSWMMSCLTHCLPVLLRLRL
jgi:hypothetical protein